MPKKKKIAVPAREYLGAEPAHGYHPGDDYDVVRIPKWGERVPEVVAEYDMILDGLGLGEPSIWFARLKSDHLARYVNGTSSNPVIVFSHDLDKQAKAQGVRLTDAIAGTLLHEYGHAFVDSAGLSAGELEDEEEVVEDFAMECGKWYIKEALEDIHRIVEAKSARMEEEVAALGRKGRRKGRR